MTTSLLAGWKRTCKCAEVTKAHLGEEITLMGWVAKARNLGQIIFVWLRDHTGLVQLVFDETAAADVMALGEALRSEYVIAIRGVVRARAEKDVNHALATGALEVVVREAKLFSSASTPPIYIDDDHPDESEAVRLKYRYLDLRRPSMQAVLRMRHRILKTLRRRFDDNGFCEIETPILTKSTPEGARDFIVPSRIHPGEFYALPQSPQIYKQLSMLAGFDRYYQVARCFRDEDNRADRQPEFTQLDIEMSFVEPEDVMGVVEGAFQAVFSELSLPVADKLERVTWREVMDRYGSDKPDRRFGLELTDITDLAKTSVFSVFETAAASGGTVRGINAKGCAARLSRKEIDALGEFVKGFGAKGLAWIALGEDGMRSSFAKFLSEQAMADLLARMDAKTGDALFFVADTLATTRNALGQLRLELGRKLDLIDKSRYDLFWVTEFPLYEVNEDGRLDAMHHPFTSVMDEDAALLDTNPADCRAKAYDLVLNGIEMGSGSIRIHSPELQNKMFELIGLSAEDITHRFGFMLEAFRYGTPPHGGFAFGIDRLVMQALGKESLRDVIAFPKVQNGSCLMMSCPSDVKQEQLDALKIKLALE